MSFNPFLGHWPFGRTSTGHPHSLKDLAEDVPFEEVEEPSKKPQIDKKARAEQVAKASEEKVSELMEKSPLAAFHALIMFSAGAKWGDEHPESDFNNRPERVSAMRAEVNSMLDEAIASDTRDFMLDAISHVIFASGVQWADKHPAPTL